MNLAKILIDRPRAISLLAIGIFLLGVMAYFSLPIAPLPNVDFPTINIFASLPGASPETAALSLAAPLERQLGQISGLQSMASTSTIGGAFITLQFVANSSINSATREVQAALQAARCDLPISLVELPTYHKTNLAGTPVGVLVMTSNTFPITQVYHLAEEIVAQRLSRITGISQVPVYGGAKTAIHVQVYPDQLANMGISLNELQNFLAYTNSFDSQGTLASSSLCYRLHTSGQILNASGYQSLAITQKNGTPIMLPSIANIIDETENTQHGGWFNGKRAVILPIFKEPDANAIRLIEEINRVLPSLRSCLPLGVYLDLVIDRTQNIRASLRDLQWSLALTIALILAVIFLFLHQWMPTFIAGAAISLALMGTFGVMALCRFSLNNISLMALTIAVGFLVDDAIVVIENIVRYIEKGFLPMQAALLGVKQVSFTVISMALSMVAILTPIFCMGGVIGLIFKEFSVSLSAVVLVSSITSLILVPTLCANFLRKKDCHAHNKILRLAESLFSKMLSCYQVGLAWVLQHQKITQGILFTSLVGSLMLYKLVPKGFFPQQDIGLIFGVPIGAQHLSYTALQAKQQQLAAILRADPAIASVISIIRRGEGFPGNSYLYVSLKPLLERKVSIEQVIHRLRPKLALMHGITLHLFPAQDLRMGGRIGMAQYQYALRADKFPILLEWTPKLVEKLRNYQQLIDVESNQEFDGLQMRVNVDHNIAGSLGIHSQQVNAALQNAFGRQKVSTVYSNVNQFHVILEASPEIAREPSSLNNIHVQSASTDHLVPLSAIANFERVKSALAVHHEDQFAAVTLSFNLKDGVSLGEATSIVEQACREANMPPSINGEFVGNAKLFKRFSLSQSLLILAAIGTVYIVLGILYESFSHPLTILSALPTAGIGALLALILTGTELNIVTMIGIILLAGIVKRNAIIMVDFAIEARRTQGLSANDAIYQAAIVRFRPILMTNVTALLGALPLAIGRGNGSELRQPLGIAIMGGVLVSQILTLFTTPVIYLTLEQLRVAARNSLRSLLLRIRA